MTAFLEVLADVRLKEKIALVWAVIISSMLMVGAAELEARAGQAVIIDHTCSDQSDTKIPLTRLNKARALNIYFGHQSVGWNILDGLESLAARNQQRYQINIIQDPPPEWFKENKGLGHAEIGENGDPSSKVRDFTEKVSSRPGLGRYLNAAIMKICFVDIQPTSNVLSIWNTYRCHMEKLKQQFPRMTVVLCTCPISATQDNGKREQFNTLVRDYARNSQSTLFDLADIEAFTPAGKPCLNRGQKSLCKLYTQDGDHPDSPEGKMRLARAFWWLMARLTGWEGL